MGKKRRKLMSPKYANKARAFREAVERGRNNNVLSNINLIANKETPTPVAVQNTENYSIEENIEEEPQAEVPIPNPIKQKVAPNALKQTAVKKRRKASGPKTNNKPTPRKRPTKKPAEA